MTKASTLLQWYIFVLAGGAGRIGASTLRSSPLQVSLDNDAASTLQTKHEQQRSEDDHQDQDHDHRILVEFDDIIDDPFRCTDACSDDEFCGRDLLCHKFESCELWYELGHPALTGLEEAEITDETKLNCVDIDDGLDRSFLWSSSICGDYSLPLAAAYFPSGTNPDERTSTCSRESEYDENESRPEFGLTFTRLCAAEPKPDFVFRCYDFSPNTNVSQHIIDSFPSSDTESTGLFQPFEVSVETSLSTDIFGVPRIQNKYTSARPIANSDLEPTDLSGKLRSVLLKKGNRYEGSFPLDCMCKPNEFCGIDGECHPYTCEQVFEFGPRRYTRYDEFPDGSTPELSCSRYDSCYASASEAKSDESRTASSFICEFGFGEAVTYPCGKNYVWAAHNFPFKDDPFLPFSRACTVTSPTGGKFVCADMFGILQKDVDSFANATSELGETCSADSARVAAYDEDVAENQTFSRYFMQKSCTGNYDLNDCGHMGLSRDRYFIPAKALSVIMTYSQPAARPETPTCTTPETDCDMSSDSLNFATLSFVWMIATSVAVLWF